mmetsp:Transcript_11317/g.39362  ORF Transcript_11317/g.39362 Transcript_11317/m.39362 type:complete len:363 (+) Transcript_11317:168-1256(+)
MSPSTMLKWLVPWSSTSWCSWFHLPPYTAASACVCASAYSASLSSPVKPASSMSPTTPSTSTKSGSPRFMRSAKACLSASTTRCARSASPAPARGSSKPPRKARACSTVAPPELGGGTPRSVCPKAPIVTGARSLGLYDLRSSIVRLPPAAVTSATRASAMGPSCSAAAPRSATARRVRPSAGLRSTSPSSHVVPSSLTYMPAAPGDLESSWRWLRSAAARWWPTLKPVSARAAAGSTSSAHGVRPCRSHMRRRPGTSPGTATARPPVLAASGFPTYIRSCAAAGASSLASTASAVPLAARTSAKHPPPTPLLCGWTTPRHSAAVTAASAAFPPRPSTSFAISEHRASSAATAPRVPARYSG